MRRWQLVAYDVVGERLDAWGWFWTRSAAEAEARHYRSPLYRVVEARP